MQHLNEKSKIPNALIGFTGFVGQTLLKQTTFDSLFRSTNICDIENRSFDSIVCAGAPAQKWIANKDPAADRKKIEALIESLKKVQCKTFILVSTVDVFKCPVGSNEELPVDETELHAYGLHRRLLEKFVESNFANHLIVRLPGLVGPGLRKNIIFDLLNDNNIAAIDSRNVFQFYPMVNLYWDIQIALRAGLKLVHLTAEPISVADIAEQCFGESISQINSTPPVSYDLRTIHASLYGATGYHQYTRQETIQAIRAYAQSEPLKQKLQEQFST